ncbi:YaaR family protein [Crassaminicella indica]|uniref:YaaR family protein n=1 Tax=Crassaminicella indica TaxID=2855394 RepID=A0ABX8R832_9CLOT|nr:YaaR family protein [Crassaminicella indica]QXM05187.1 YaaR family protein [Crassaminicella indica]
MNTIQPIQTPNIQKNTPVNKAKALSIQTTFMEKFEKIKSDEVKEHAKKIYDKIVEKSEKIGDRLYIQDLLDYKKLVKEFLNIVVTNSHVFTKENFLDRRGRHRVFSQVKQVDKALADLTNDFLSQEVDRIKIVKKLDDIRGILLDMFM